MQESKTYLGDGLYAEDDGFQFRLFTDQGNEVFIDPDTLMAFIRFLEKARKISINVVPKDV